MRVAPPRLLRTDAAPRHRHRPRRTHPTHRRPPVRRSRRSAARRASRRRCLAGRRRCRLPIGDPVTRASCPRRRRPTQPSTRSGRPAPCRCIPPARCPSAQRRPSLALAPRPGLPPPGPRTQPGAPLDATIETTYCSTSRTTEPACFLDVERRPAPLGEPEAEYGLQSSHRTQITNPPERAAG
jgi:hypothetical protein